jgi:hypothetical protein
MSRAEFCYAPRLREAGVMGWLREKINAARPSRYGTALQFGDRSGLAEIDRREGSVTNVWEAVRQLALEL